MALADNLNSTEFGTDLDALDAVEAELAKRSAGQRIEFVLRDLPGTHVVSSSFGAQAAVTLHLMTRYAPKIPVVLVDTGYLFPETYQFVDTLTERLGLNLQVVRPEISPSWLEARHGKLWEQGIEGLEQYGEIAKAEPMRRALQSLEARTWISGLRRSQSNSRAKLRIVEHTNGRFKFHPIADWTDRDIGRYMLQHQLPYHPLWDKGYVSIGDWHTTRPLSEAGSVEATRFFGLKRECGLHGLAG